MASFVKLSVQEIFDNIQHFRNSDGSICESSLIGFGSEQEQKANSTKATDFGSLIDALMDNYAKSFSKSSKPDETVEAQAKYIINILDTDKNGAISKKELYDFENSNSNSNLEKPISDLEDQFKIYDIDKDGELNLTEIKKALGSKNYSSQELSQMSKEFNDNTLINTDYKPLIQESDTI